MSETKRNGGDHDDDNSCNEEESWKDSDFLFFDSSPYEDNSDDVNNSNNHNNKHNPTQLVNPNNDPNRKRLPPWMDKPHEQTFRSFNTPKLILLHEEIVQFVNLMKPQKQEIEIREDFVQKVKELILNLFQKDYENNDTESIWNRSGKGMDERRGNKEKKKKGCEVHVFGSQATGLLLPSSDIDLVVILPDYDPDTDTYTNKKNINNNNNDSSDSKKQSNNETLLTKEEEQREMAEYDIHKHSSANLSTSSPLIKLASELHTKWKNELTYLEVVSNTKVPIVKFTHGPTNLSCDICFNQENGLHAAELMKRFMDAMPPLKPLTFVLKYFMAARGLNEPYSGGCGSFMIQMMIVSFLQHRERYDYNNPANHRYNHHQQRRDYNNRHNHRGNNNDDDYDPAPMNLGSLLLEFFELYGIDFNYLTTAISVRHDGYYFPKGHYNKRDIFFTNPTRTFTLGLENPIDITMDVGKSSFRMSLIQKSYEVALRVLLSHVAHPVVHVESILESIIPPTEEMYKRATMYKVLSIEESLKNQVANADKKRRGTYNQQQNGKIHNKRRCRSSTESSMDTSDSD